MPHPKRRTGTCATGLIFPCRFCGKVYTSEFGLRLHKIVSHNVSDRIDTNHGHFFEDCGEIFEKEFQMKAHMWREHKI